MRKKNYQVISIAIDRETLAQLDGLKERKYLTRTALINQILVEYLQKRNR